MGKRVNIPVRVIRSTESESVPPAQEATTPAGGTASPDGRLHADSPEDQRVALAVETGREKGRETDLEPLMGNEPCEELDEWRDRALRLQADMENYRKRQQRIAQDQIVQERSRLLNAFLGIVDDLERALEAPASDNALLNGDALRRGVELTHRAAKQLLEKEGAVAIPAKHQPFDPNWHEAVATTPRNGSEVAPGTVIQVVETGYRLGDQLLRPAKVVVAV